MLDCLVDEFLYAGIASGINWDGDGGIAEGGDLMRYRCDGGGRGIWVWWDEGGRMREIRDGLGRDNDCVYW